MNPVSWGRAKVKYPLKASGHKMCSAAGCGVLGLAALPGKAGQALAKYSRRHGAWRIACKNKRTALGLSLCQKQRLREKERFQNGNRRYIQSISVPWRSWDVPLRDEHHGRRNAENCREQDESVPWDGDEQADPWRGAGGAGPLAAGHSPVGCGFNSVYLRGGDFISWCP